MNRYRIKWFFLKARCNITKYRADIMERICRVAYNSAPKSRLTALMVDHFYNLVDRQIELGKAAKMFLHELRTMD